MNFRHILLCVALTGVGSAHAEKQPDPVEFVTGIVSLSELCPTRDEAMKSAPQKLLDGMTASELASIESIKSAPRYADAWKKARETVAKLPPEKVLAECQSIMATKPRAR